MKLSRKSFGVKLWSYFVLFAVLIFSALWLLQIVFLQSFYNGMVTRNVAEVAKLVAGQRDAADLEGVIDNATSENSLLIFLTDRQGSVLYSSDEHSGSYRERGARRAGENGRENPYRDNNQLLNWQIGAYRYLPDDYDAFLQKLLESETGEIGYQREDGAAYVYGAVLPASGRDTNLLGGREAVLYISTPLGAVSATVGILRAQLVWVTLASLVVGLVIAFLIARRLARPISAISAQARHMADGGFDATFEKGFCAELDGLSDTLSRTAADLSQAERFRREFLANVSHDLRTPLTMIKGYAEMVRDISWEDAETRGADLEIIIRETDRLTGLVNEILEYSALQSGKRGPHFEKVDLSEAVWSVAGQFKPLCGQGGYHIETEVTPGLTVWGDRKQLERVLYNLIDNAVSHAGSHRQIDVSLKDAGTRLRFEVRDYGKGIPRQELPFIWERYFTSKTRGHGAKGAGLGLAIAKEILLCHEAEFGVESEAGQGSTFWFSLIKI